MPVFVTSLKLLGSFDVTASKLSATSFDIKAFDVTASKLSATSFDVKDA